MSEQDEDLVKNLCKDVLDCDYINIYDGTIYIRTGCTITYKILDKLAKLFETSSISISLSYLYTQGSCKELGIELCIENIKYNADKHTCPIQKPCGERW